MDHCLDDGRWFITARNTKKRFREPSLVYMMSQVQICVCTRICIFIFCLGKSKNMKKGQKRNGYRTDRERDGDSGYVEWRTDT